MHMPPFTPQPGPLIWRWTQAAHNELIRRQVAPLESAISYLIPLRQDGKIHLAGFTFLVDRQEGASRAFILHRFAFQPQPSLEFDLLEEFPRQALTAAGEPLPSLVGCLSRPAAGEKRAQLEAELFTLCECWLNSVGRGRSSQRASARFVELLESLSPVELMKYYQFCAPQAFTPRTGRAASDVLKHYFDREK